MATSQGCTQNEEPNAALAVVRMFEGLLVPINEAPELMGYSVQYGRRLILDNAHVDRDLFLVAGRWFVTRTFIAALKDR